MQELIKLYELIAELSPVAIVVTRGTGPLYYNRAYLNLLGYEQEEKVVFNEAFTHVHPEDRVMVAEYNRRRLRGEEAPNNYEIRMVKKNGEVIDVEVSATRIIYQGEPAALSYLRDITLRKKMARDLAESAEKYRSVVENALEAVFIVQDGQIKFANRATSKLSGWSYEELTSRPFVDFIHPSDREFVHSNYLKRIMGEDVPPNYEFRIQGPEGEVKWVELMVVWIEWEGKPATLNFLRDITEHKELEARMLRAGRIEAVGVLAGGIAHDFNNILMGIMGHASLMLLEVEKSHPHYERLKAIENQVQAAAELTKQLLSYARAGRYNVEISDVNEALRQMVKLFWRAKKGVRINQHYDPNLWPVEIDKEQMGEVFRQIFLNSYQAMPGGGVVTVRTENVELKEQLSRTYRRPAGKYVHITLGDNGQGMSQEIRDRLFEPYFTTREMGRGVGLGMAAAYGIVKGHGGFIEVESEEGVGTTFHIYLPASGRMEKIASDYASPEATAEERKTILVVEDEKLVADVTMAMLKHLGYEVLTAANGKEALQIYGETRPDLVILDMIMPEMPGEEVFKRIRRLNPEARIILASGYSLEESAREILDEPMVEFLHKPYQLQELAQKLEALLRE